MISIRTRTTSFVRRVERGEWRGRSDAVIDLNFWPTPAGAGFPENIVLNGS